VASDALDLSDAEVAQTIHDFGQRDSKLTWFLLTYAKGSNRLKLVGTGEGGLDELTEELDNGKAMYGLFRFRLNEERVKIVYLTWVPDGVPTVIKGTVNTHAGQIAKSMKARALRARVRATTCSPPPPPLGLTRWSWQAFHVQINARTEDDLDEAVLRKKIELSAGARY
jgi:drebrin-like protein